MALNVSAWSISKPLPGIVFSIIIILIGVQSFIRLPITRLPTVDLPIVAVVVTQFGASPSELEAQVTKTIEDAASGVEGVKHIASSITDGVSFTTITFNLDANPDRALNDVKDAVTRVRPNLPHDVAEPLIQHIDVVGLGILTYAAIAPGKTPEQLSWFVDDVVKRSLQGLVGVGGVERIGGVEREILVALDPDRLCPAAPPLRWSPVVGCEDVRVAERRASALVAAAAPLVARHAAAQQRISLRMSVVSNSREVLQSAIDQFVARHPGAEIRLTASVGSPAVTAQLLTPGAGSRQTLSVAMEEIRLRLRDKGIALASSVARGRPAGDPRRDGGSEQDPGGGWSTGR